MAPHRQGARAPYSFPARAFDVPGEVALLAFFLDVSCLRLYSRYMRTEIRPGRRTRGTAQLLVPLSAALLVVLAIACTSGSSEEPSPGQPGPFFPSTAEATPPVTVVPQACAGGSFEDFKAAEEEVGFTVFCPTFLPEGFKLDSLRVNKTPADPLGNTTDTYFLNATFADGEGLTLVFMQGYPGILFESAATLARGDQSPEGLIAYADFQVQFYLMVPADDITLNPMVFGRGADGANHFISGFIEDEELKQVVASMQRPTS